MSTHALPWHPSASAIEAIAAVTAVLRAPASTRQEGGNVVFEFVPDLTPAEATTLAAAVASVVGATRARDVSLTVAEFRVIEPHLATLRTLQQLSRNEFMALTAADRDRMLFDNVTALLRVVRALLRD